MTVAVVMAARFSNFQVYDWQSNRKAQYKRTITQPTQTREKQSNNTNLLLLLLPVIPWRHCRSLDSCWRTGGRRWSCTGTRWCIARRHVRSSAGTTRSYIIGAWIWGGYWTLQNSVHLMFHWFCIHPLTPWDLMAIIIRTFFNIKTPFSNVPTICT